MDKTVTLVSTSDTPEQVQHALTGTPPPAAAPAAAEPPAAPAATDPPAAAAAEPAATEPAAVAGATPATPADETPAQKTERERRDGKARGRIERIETEIAALTRTKHDVRRDVEAEEARLTELRAESERLQAEIGARATTAMHQPGGSPAAAPADAKPEPKLEDTNADGSPTFASFEAWQVAHSKWSEESVLSKVEQRLIKEREEREIAERARIERDSATRAQDEALAQHQTNIESFRSQHADFDAVIDDVKETVIELREEHGKGVMNTIDTFMVKDAENGPAILYHLAKNPDELREIAALDPPRQLIRLAKLDAKLATKKPATTSAKDGSDRVAPPVTQAPPPTRPVGAGPTAPAAVSLDEADYATYKRTRQEQLAARGR